MKITRFWKHFLASACIIGILASGLCRCQPGTGHTGGS